MKILLDMNLSPSWQPVLNQYGYDCLHWSNVGSPLATDQEILEWAKKNNYIIFTHDLDFGALLAISRSGSPSVMQMRTQNTLPDVKSRMIVQCLKQFEKELERGALIVIDVQRARVRLLPLTE